MAQVQKKRRSRRWIFIVLLLLLGLGGGFAYLVATGKIQRPGASSAVIPTGVVTTVTAVSSVTDSGPVAAQQSAAIARLFAGRYGRLLPARSQILAGESQSWRARRGERPCSRSPCP